MLSGGSSARLTGGSGLSEAADAIRVKGSKAEPKFSCNILCTSDTKRRTIGARRAVLSGSLEFSYRSDSMGVLVSIGFELATRTNCSGLGFQSKYLKNVST